MIEAVFIAVGIVALVLFGKNIVPVTPSPSKKSNIAGDFVALVKKSAQSVDMAGIPVNFAIAQAGVETGWGTGGVFKKTNSLFNIKVTPSWTGGYYQVTNSDGLVRFRSYSTVADSLADWVKLISKTNYYKEAYAKALRGDAPGFFHALQTLGYAGSDTAYAAKLTKALGGIA